MKLLRKVKYIGITLLLVMMLPTSGMSQSDSIFSSDAASYWVAIVLFFLVLIVLGITYNVYTIVKMMVINEEKRKAKEAGIEYVPAEGVMSKIMASWNDSVPIEEEQSITLDHEYDGIKELDNHLPPWWLGLFYGSIVFGAVYLLGYHVMDWWPLQEEEYENQLAAVAKDAPEEITIDENAIEYNPDLAFLNSGKTIYSQKCSPCHGGDGGGTIGPNLADKYWLHGGSITDIYKTIKIGVPSKGMAAWEKALSPVEIAQLSSYIISIAGSEVAAPKEPQGELYEPDSAQEEQPETSETVDDGENSGDSK